MAAIRAPAWSPRVFFLIGFNQELWAKAKSFAEAWPAWLEWKELTGPPDDLGLPPYDPYSIWAEERLDKFAEQLGSGIYDKVLGLKPRETESTVEQ